MKRWGKRNLEDRCIGGEAAISVSHAGPFTAVVESSTDPRPTAEEVRGVWNSGHFDSYTMPAGTTAAGQSRQAQTKNRGTV